MTILTIHLSSNRSPPEEGILVRSHHMGAVAEQVLAAGAAHTRHNLHIQHRLPGVHRSLGSTAAAAPAGLAVVAEAAAILESAGCMQAGEQRNSTVLAHCCRQRVLIVLLSLLPRHMACASSHDLAWKYPWPDAS
jgi:hypothetical protein